MASVLETGGNESALLAKKQRQIFPIRVPLHSFCNFNRDFMQYMQESSHIQDYTVQ